MSSIKGMLRQMAGPDTSGPRSSPPPTYIAGEEVSLCWDEQMGGGGASTQSSQASSLASPLTEVPGHRVYHSTRAIETIIANGVERRVLQEMRTIASILVEDANGQQVRVHFSDAYRNIQGAT